MKKYWKLLTIALLIFLTLGTFYLNSSFAAMKYPEFIIKHQTGDEKEVEHVAISARLTDGEKEVYTQITPAGTNYVLNMSYLDFIRGADQSALMNRLKKEYYNFMRGKYDMESQYYEDEHVLAYVNMRSDYGASRYGQWNYSFEVDVLDKGSHKTTSFKVKIPDYEQFNYVQVQRVQISDGQIKIITANDLVTHANRHYVQRTELHLYSISIKDEKLIRDDIVSGTDNLDEKYSVSVNLLRDNEQIGSNNHLVYSVDITEEVINDEGFGGFKSIERSVVAYDLTTNEQKKILLSDEYGDHFLPEFLSGQTIYFSREQAGQLELLAYNLVSEQIVANQTFALTSGNDEERYSYAFNDDKLYLLHQLKAGNVDAKISIVDVKTGDLLYEGSVEIAKESKEKYNIDMYYLEVR